MNTDGCSQAQLDINRLQIALQPFLNKHSKNLLEESLKAVQDLEKNLTTKALDRWFYRVKNPIK